MTFEQLQELVDEYGKHKDIYNQYKKTCDEENTLIKDNLNKLITDDQDKCTLKGNKYTCTLSISHTENFDDKLLIEKLHELYGGENCPYIKTVEVPDMNAIESAIYHGDIDAVELSSCIITKTTPRLTIKLNK